MSKKTGIALGILLATGATSYAQWPVIDGTAAANFKKEFEEMGKQVKLAQAQLQQAQNMYKSVTGNRSFGELLKDRKIEDLLPKDMQNLYSDLSKNGITGSVREILNSEKQAASVEDISKSIDERQRQSTAIEKALGMKAFEAAQERLERLDELRQKIGQAGDPKAIGELQARLQVEQAAIQSETNKLQIMQQMQENESKLIDLQRQELNQRIFNKNNTEMPQIK